MLKLMIVDDEWIVQEGIKKTIENNFEHLEIVHLASSGREAIEKATEYYPDIIFMDIKMPGINGIEAIETIKRRHQDVKFVIISAYEQFEFAKQAVELGVSHYILKPINQNRLVEVVNSVTEEIKLEQEQRRKSIQNREKLEKAMPALEKGFIYSILMNVDYSNEYKRYQEIFEINKDNAYVAVLEIGGNDTLDGEIVGEAIYSKLQDLFKFKCKCIIGPLIINRVTLVIFQEVLEFEYEQRVASISLANAVLKQLKQYTDETITIGLGSCTTVSKIRTSLEEANYAISRMDSEPVLHYKDLISSKNQHHFSYLEIKDDEQTLVKLLEQGNVDLLAVSVSKFFRKIKSNFNIENGKNIVIELMVLVLSASYRNGIEEASAGYTTYLSDIKRINDWRQLETWSIRRMTLISEKIQFKKTAHVSNVVLKAKEFIDSNYKDDISLNEISKYVSVSPQYFSTIFKEELGMNFVEYLRGKRVDVAKELLKTKKYSVKEICYEVGYNDPNYFSRLFKKIVGVSPTEYK